MLVNSVIVGCVCFLSFLHTEVRAACTGVMSVTAVASEIHDMSQNEFHEDVGKVAYSLDSSGNLNLTSISPTWNCGAVTNFVSSNNTASSSHKDDKTSGKSSKAPADNQQPTQSVGAQLHCFNQQEPIDTTWSTPWKTIVFYGSLFVQIEMKGDNCTKPADLILDYSRCSYNTTTATGRSGTAIPCQWKAMSEIGPIASPSPPPPSQPAPIQQAPIQQTPIQQAPSQASS